MGLRLPFYCAPDGALKFHEIFCQLGIGLVPERGIQVKIYVVFVLRAPILAIDQSTPARKSRVLLRRLRETV